MPKLIVSVWIAYWFGLIFLPFIYVYGSVFQAGVLQVVFVAAFVGSYHMLARPSTADISIGVNEILLAYFGILISIVGVWLLAFDKIAIQGIDYTKGIAFAREEWRRLGEGRSAPSSLFSIIGYAIGSTYFISSGLSIYWAGKFEMRNFYAINIIAFIICLMNTVITGGRSIIVLYAVFCVVAFAANPQNRIRHLFPRPTAAVILVAAVVVFFSYSLFVIGSRSSANGLRPLEYAYNFLPYLGIYIDPNFLDYIGTGIRADVVGILSVAAGYLVHSAVTFGAILENPEQSGTVLFTHVLTLGGRLGLWDAPDAGWFLSGRFASVPGLLWLQFGGWALLAGGIVIGSAMAAFQRWVQASPHSVIPIVGLASVGSIAILSPLSFAGDFLAFPFIVIGAVIMEIARLMLDYFRPKARSRD